jgi:hypothetical protein
LAIDGGTWDGGNVSGSTQTFIASETAVTLFAGSGFDHAVTAVESLSTAGAVDGLESRIAHAIGTIGATTRCSLITLFSFVDVQDTVSTELNAAGSRRIGGTPSDLAHAIDTSGAGRVAFFSVDNIDFSVSAVGDERSSQSLVFVCRSFPLEDCGGALISLVILDDNFQSGILGGNVKRLGSVSLISVRRSP